MATKLDFPFFDFSKVMQEFKMPGGDGFKMPGLDMDAFVASQRRNVEALTQANKLAAEGFQTIARRQAEIFRTTLTDFSELTRDLMAKGNQPADQTERVKQTFESAVANMRELTELATKANQEVFEVLNRRVAEGIEELRSLAPKT
ncbi:phasin family protein [Zavarzinia sp. CC-PAN008]|uniref:phasin family protein n=1 Tax=Zavarzinia sp. CC-PAN008 TaxID=3243332 RepID=UPI003F744786